MITNSEIKEELKVLKEYIEEEREINLIEINDRNRLVTLGFKIRNGYTYDLAEEKVWPFTEFIKSHDMRMLIPPTFPRTYPILTWLTDITHPNIVPQKRNGVCANILSEKWSKIVFDWPRVKVLPFIPKFVLGVLKNPWPMYGFGDTSERRNAIKVCSEHKFPKVWPPPRKLEKKGKILRGLKI